MGLSSWQRPLHHPRRRTALTLARNRLASPVFSRKVRTGFEKFVSTIPPKEVLISTGMTAGPSTHELVEHLAAVHTASQIQDHQAEARVGLEPLTASYPSLAIDTSNPLYARRESGFHRHRPRGPGRAGVLFDFLPLVRPERPLDRPARSCFGLQSIATGCIIPLWIAIRWSVCHPSGFHRRPETVAGEHDFVHRNATLIPATFTTHGTTGTSCCSVRRCSSGDPRTGSAQAGQILVERWYPSRWRRSC